MHIEVEPGIAGQCKQQIADGNVVNADRIHLGLLAARPGLWRQQRRVNQRRWLALGLGIWAQVAGAGLPWRCHTGCQGTDSQAQARNQPPHPTLARRIPLACDHLLTGRTAGSRVVNAV